MNPDRWRRIEELCHAAAARAPSERAAFLAEACGDDVELRREVESLLAEESRAEDFLLTGEDGPAFARRHPSIGELRRGLAKAEREDAMIGSLLGPYRVLEKLGEGGMGEVYKARDTRLDRTVAIKILPPDVASDPDRRARFEREAKTISQLNHPHICALYDVDMGDGSSSDDPRSSRPPFLVMEHLEGETLAARLDRGPIPLQDALRIGAEIADALAAAHRHGVVHRDLKPGNVMLVRAHGSSAPAVKLLDFGLAKLKGGFGLQASGFGPRTTASATEPEPLTSRGVILGTLPYMAPEQLEGKPADARTDLWALGTILYEMLTGTRAFEGGSSAALIGAILEREPESLAACQPVTPPALDRLVRKCLAKAPDDRWDSAHDIADELRWISQTGTAAGSAATPPRPARWRAAVFAIGALAIAIIAAGLSWRAARRVAAPPREVQHLLLDVRPADGLLGSAAQERAAHRRRPARVALALSPDGRVLVFSAVRGDRQQLFVRRLDQAEATPISGTEGGENPFFSPDGQWVGFWANGAMLRVRVEGGAPVRVCETDRLFGASWSLGDTIVFAGGESGPLLAVPAAGGVPRPLTVAGSASSRVHRLPHVLPNGRAVLFTVLSTTPASGAGWSSARVEVQSLATGERKIVLEDAADARYLPTGHLVYMRRGTFEAVPFDLQRLEVTGGAVGLVPDVMQSVNTGNTTTETGAAQVALSATGTLVYVAGGSLPDREFRLMWVDRRGRVEEVPGPARGYVAPRLSPDGRRVAVHTIGMTGGVWVYDLTRSALTRLTPDGQLGGWPVWTPDGKRVVYRGTGRLFWRPADQSTVAEPLTPVPPESGSSPAGPAAWSPDGRELVFLQGTPAGLWDIWVLRLKGQQWTAAPWLATAANRKDPVLSPDGRWLAYTSDESGRWEVWVQAFSGAGGRQQVSLEGGRSPLWAPTGRELYYLDPPDAARPNDARLFAVDVAATTPLGIGQPHVLFAVRRTVLSEMLRGYDIAPDGRRFLFLQIPDTPPAPFPREMHVIFNWFEDLKAKVPAGR